MGLAFLVSNAVVAASLTSQRSTAAAGAINGTAVDIAAYTGNNMLAWVNAPVASSGDTITFTVEHSEASGSGFSAVPAAALVSAATGAAATFTVVTDAVAVSQALGLDMSLLKRYVRLVATTAGSSIDVNFFGGFIALDSNV